MFLNQVTGWLGFYSFASNLPLLLYVDRVGGDEESMLFSLMSKTDGWSHVCVSVCALFVGALFLSDISDFSCDSQEADSPLLP